MDEGLRDLLGATGPSRRSLRHGERHFWFAGVGLTMDFVIHGILYLWSGEDLGHGYLGESASKPI